MSRRRLSIALGALALLGLALPTAGQAAGFSVTTTADSGAGSLRAAIEAANASSGPDVVSIGATGTIDLETVLPSISEDLVLNGPGQTGLTVRRNAGSFRIFSVSSEISTTFRDMTISNGRSTSGAGINSFGPLTLERVSVSANQAVGVGGTQAVAQGGGILSFGPLVLRESTISGNTATASDGTSQTVAQEAGVAAFDTALIERSTISGNIANATSSGTQVVAQGGGLALFGETATIDRSTISGNSVSAANGASQTVAQGGGVEGFEGILITGSTITGNSASSTQIVKGANLLGETTIRDTIISNPQGGTPSCSTAQTSAGFNIDDGNSCGFAQPTDLSSTNPGINPSLAANDGPTLTHALLPGSVAVDRGNAFGATTDQRGFRRPSDFGAIPNALGGDGSDVGAYEEQDVVAPDTTIDKGPPRKTRKRVATFLFSSNEAGASFQCSLDGRPFAPCAAPLTFKVKRGKSHVFAVRAVDVAGNVDAGPAQYKWRVKRKKHHKRHHRRHHKHHHHKHHLGR
jgi:hypothetical protein